MSIIANQSQYKRGDASRQYTDVKIAEHNVSADSHSDLRTAIAQVAQDQEIEKNINKNQPNGYAGLDEGEKLDIKHIPVIGTEQIEENAVSESKLSQDLSQKINGKVDAVSGQGLSDNNYDDEAVALVSTIGDVTGEVQNLETNKANQVDLDYHAENQTLHIKPEERQGWNQKLDPSLINASSGVAGIGQDGFIQDQFIKNTIARKTDVTALQESKLDKSGGTMTGALDMSKKNIENVHLVQLHGLRNPNMDGMDGIYMYGDLYMRGCQITGVGDAIVNPRDAANKKYVDDSIKSKMPAQGTKTATSTGTAGQMAYDNDYFYLCIATDTWVRFAKSTW